METLIKSHKDDSRGLVPAAMVEYQPKTGERCSCRRGVQRDNCPTCEGTGMVIDFAAIRTSYGR